MRDTKIDNENDRLLSEAESILSENIDELLDSKIKRITDGSEKNKVIAIINEHKARWAEEEVEREKENQKLAIELEQHLHDQKIYHEKELWKLKITMWSVGIILLALYIFIEFSTNV